MSYLTLNRGMPFEIVSPLNPFFKKRVVISDRKIREHRILFCSGAAGEAAAGAGLLELEGRADDEPLDALRT